MVTKKLLLSIATILFACIFVSAASGQGVREKALFPGTISGICFNDANLNGIKDAGEAGVEGITVSLKRMVFFMFPKEAGAATADADGSYEITGLRPGLYLVEVQNSSAAECITKNPVLTWLGFFNKKKTADFGFTVTVCRTRSNRNSGNRRSGRTSKWGDSGNSNHGYGRIHSNDCMVASR